MPRCRGHGLQLLGHRGMDACEGGQQAGLQHAAARLDGQRLLEHRLVRLERRQAGGAAAFSIAGPKAEQVNRMPLQPVPRT
jgi:hypothetical protein